VRPLPNCQRRIFASSIGKELGTRRRQVNFVARNWAGMMHDQHSRSTTGWCWRASNSHAWLAWSYSTAAAELPTLTEIDFKANSRFHD